MSLFEGTAPPNIESTETVKTTAPQYLTDYLTSLAEAGQGALDQTNLIANLPSNLQGLYKYAPEVLGRYQSPLEQAATAGEAAGQAIGSTDISAFYNPYEQDVVNDLARQSAENVQRGMLPALRGAFAGQGAFGSRRYAGALGQAMADVQGDLLGQQSKLKSEGYKAALDAALRQKGLQSQAAQALTGVGQAEAQGASSGLKALGDIGMQELAYEQSKLEAPLTRAQNVAQIMRGYTYPTTSEKKYVGPGQTYGPSPLSQIAGLGTLVGSAFGNKGAIGNKFLDWLGKFGSNLPTDISVSDFSNYNYPSSGGGSADTSDLNDWYG